MASLLEMFDTERRFPAFLWAELFGSVIYIPNMFDFFEFLCIAWAGGHSVPIFGRFVRLLGRYLRK